MAGLAGENVGEPGARVDAVYAFGEDRLVVRRDFVRHAS
jgi:hypothetical protein